MMAERKTFRIPVLISYLIILEMVVAGITALSIFSIFDESTNKLRIFEQFDYDIQHLPAIMVCVAGICTLLSSVPGFISACKKNQVLTSIFISLMVLSAFMWFGIGAWCISLHNLIMDNNLSIWFRQLKERGASGDANLILQDLRDYMPRISSQHNFICCQGIPSDALVTCAQDCEFQYKKLFTSIVFPVIYSTVFTGGLLCILALLSGCFVCCYLDDVKPAL